MYAEVIGCTVYMSAQWQNKWQNKLVRLKNTGLGSIHTKLSN